MQVTIHTDGGALGNPGPSAIGVVIETPETKKTYAEDIGEGTNNEAEYKALIFALRKAKSLIGGEKAKKSQITCFADSELMVKQLNHQYQIKNERIAKLFIEIWNLMLEYDKVEFIHVLREKNQEADALVKSIFAKNRQRNLISF
jgi:ribonuclease HI